MSRKNVISASKADADRDVVLFATHLCFRRTESVAVSQEIRLMLSLKKMSGEDSEDKRDAVFVKVTDSLSEAQRLMLNAQQLMEAEAEKLAQERKEFEEIRKKLDHVHFGKTVKLNVGGKIFKTSLETLCKDPRSMLAAMFSGRFELKPDEDGAYFIDRDGKLFR